MVSIDWKDPAAKVSRHFSVREALWLPRWGRMATEADGLDEAAKAGLLELFRRMDLVRDFLGAPIDVHVAFRPWPYNKLIGGAPGSSHIAREIQFQGKSFFVAAVDWSAQVFEHVGAFDCDRIRELLEPKLSEFDLRMERLPAGSTWVHTDSHPILPGHARFFNP